ncbi:transposase [Streptomyces sp. NPDC059556]|uniref:transposase n=1 Tax=Streptomyces sp. NPDC059556 TaxID=3346863 RepID=UPI0036AD0167
MVAIGVESTASYGTGFSRARPRGPPGRGRGQPVRPRRTPQQRHVRPHRRLRRRPGRTVRTQVQRAQGRDRHRHACPLQRRPVHGQSPHRRHQPGRSHPGQCPRRCPRSPPGPARQDADRHARPPATPRGHGPYRRPDRPEGPGQAGPDPHRRARRAHGRTRRRGQRPQPGPASRLRHRSRHRGPAPDHRRRQSDRFRTEASFAALCRVAPVPASSGKTTRYRLSRGGDRAANAALYRTVLVRMASDARDQRTLPETAGVTGEGGDLTGLA